MHELVEIIVFNPNINQNLVKKLPTQQERMGLEILHLS